MVFLFLTPLQLSGTDPLNPSSEELSMDAEITQRRSCHPASSEWQNTTCSQFKNVYVCLTVVHKSLFLSFLFKFTQ